MSTALKMGAGSLSTPFDQNQLCCGSLCEAVVVDGIVVLQCLACGMTWEKRTDGSFAPLAAYDASRKRKRPIQASEEEPST